MQLRHVTVFGLVQRAARTLRCQTHAAHPGQMTPGAGEAYPAHLHERGIVGINQQKFTEPGDVE